jgi:hypothetical protein
MFREALLIRTLTQLADRLVDDFDVIDVLTILSDRCIEVLDVDAAGFVVTTGADDLQVVASSSEAAPILELFEVQASQGPAFDCSRTGESIINRQLSPTDEYWPTFAPLAVEAGFRSVNAIPMRLRGHTLGALTLLRTDTGLLVEADVTAGQALADVATIAIVQSQVTLDAQGVTAQLADSSSQRVVIEQAKGMLAEALGVDIDQALLRLGNYARNHDLSLADLARDIAEGTVDPRSLDSLRPGPIRR